MSRYSLTNECIQSINDYDDQSFIAEMNVLSALLDSYEKAITIMEYSGNVPEINDLSLFQESTFFQEEVENGQTSGSVSDSPTESKDNAQQDSQNKDNNNTNNNQNNGQQQKTMSEKERKEHNKEHWIRQTNKKGNVENIFISIIAFIPRFFMFLGRCLVKLFKKITGKDVKKETEDIKNADPAKKDEAVKNIENAINNPDNSKQDSQNEDNNNTSNNQTADESSAEPVVFQINSQSPENLKAAEEIIKTNNVTGLDYNKLTNIFNEILNNVIQNIQMDTAADQVNPNDGKAVNSMRDIIPKLKKALENKITIDDTAYVEAFENFKKVCDNVQKVSNNKAKEFSEWQEKIKNESGKGIVDLKVVNSKREIVMGLRDLCKIIAEASNAAGNDYSKNCKAIDTAVKFLYGKKYNKFLGSRLNPTAAAAEGKRDVKADNAEIINQMRQSQSGGTTNTGGGGDNQ